MEYAYHVFLLLGGIGLFLFGINFMGTGLERAAGDNLRVILQKLTTKSGNAVVVGALMTAVIQSSGATMVMVIGFVNAQLMGLVQALYVMLGAAIGTTITSQIIAFNIQPLAPLILFVGYILYKFVRNRTCKQVGEIVLGFGLLFLGIYLMGDAIDMMELGGVILAFLNRFSNPLLSFLFGVVFTLVIQSCSASVGILQVLVAGAGAGFGLASVVYMVLGMNVGAVAPVVLSSFSANRAARRATLAEVLSKLASALIFIVLILIAPKFITLIEGTSPDPSRQIANLHLIFNVISAVVLFPLVKPLAKLSEKIMPDEPDAEFYAPKLIYINENVKLTTASLALAQVRKEVVRFGQLCVENFERAIGCFFKMNEEEWSKVFTMEDTINFLNHEINVYLVKVSSLEVTEKESDEINSIITVATDLERIADHAENFAEYAQLLRDKKAKLSEDAIADLKTMIDETVRMIRLCIKIFETEDIAFLDEANSIEDRIDDMQDILIDHHIERLRANICDPRGGVLYTDLVSELERCGDHAMNIAESVFGKDAPIEELSDVGHAATA